MPFTQTVPGFINQVQTPVLLVSKIKTEAPMVIKNEPPESEMMEIDVGNILGSAESEEKFIPDIKDIDIVLHPLCEDSIKSETVPEDLLETKHLESGETQVYVKTENLLFVNTENIIQSENLYKTEYTSNGNRSWGTGQGAIEVLGSNEHFNASGNLETDEQLVINLSGDLKGIGTNSRKAKHPEKTDFAQCYKTNETTSWEKEKEKLEIIRAPIIPVEPHEYISLAEDKHVCNHCQHSSKTVKLLKAHIRRLHRKVATMYQCPYCPHKSYSNLRDHIILKHKSAKDIQWFQCHLCELKFKLKCILTRHLKVHLKHKQMQDALDLHEKRYRCDKCNYKTDKCSSWKNHKLIHLKPEEIQYFYCYHCSHKSIQKANLKKHIFKHFKNEEIRFYCYNCDFVTLKRELINYHIKNHVKVQIKFEINEES